jgi:phospholipid/cholesterol/gamma-HCH transport system ATP-binding protein
MTLEQVKEQMEQERRESANGEAGGAVDPETVVSVRNLTKRFGRLPVLEDVSLDIKRGKTTVVIGPSGCGKTVLIKHLIVLLRPTSGEVYFKDKRIDNMPEQEVDEIRTHFGFLFQGGALFDSLSVAENVMFPIRQHYKVTNWGEVKEVVQAKLAMVGLDGFQDYYPARLSGGQKKRVALARAIAMNPEVMLYDEPTTGLDPIRADVINELILKMERELGVTSVVVTHDMTSAYKIADRIVMLHDGRIIADGDPEYIRKSENPTVQQFVRGQVSKEDLDVLRMSGKISRSLPGTGELRE